MLLVISSCLSLAIGPAAGPGLDALLVISSCLLLAIGPAGGSPLDASIVELEGRSARVVDRGRSDAPQRVR